MTLEQEREIVRKYESGETQTSIALEYNVHQTWIGKIIKKHRGLANMESNYSNRHSATASSIPAYVVHDQSQNFYSTHMFQNAVQSRMLYAQVGSEFSARTIAPMWSQPVQISSSGGCGRPSSLPVGYASALFAAAASSEASNASGTDCTFRVTHPSACRGAEVQAPRQHSRILPTPANFAPRGDFTDQPMVGLAAETRVEFRGGERPPSLAPKQIPNISSTVGVLPLSLSDRIKFCLYLCLTWN